MNQPIYIVQIECGQDKNNIEKVCYIAIDNYSGGYPYLTGNIQAIGMFSRLKDAIIEVKYYLQQPMHAHSKVGNKDDFYLPALRRPLIPVSGTFEQLYFAIKIVELSGKALDAATIRVITHLDENFYGNEITPDQRRGWVEKLLDSMQCQLLHHTGTPFEIKY